MVFTFLVFGYRKWLSFDAYQLVPFISHSPLGGMRYQTSAKSPFTRPVPPRCDHRRGEPDLARSENR
jgi:uncharacterized membrane protein YkgB